MRKYLISVLSFVCLCALSFAQNTFVQVPKATAAITIDGEIDEAWDTAPLFTIDNWGDDNPVPDASDFSSSFKLLWDESYIYFLGVLTDDILMDQAACSDAGLVDWEVDNYELYWSPGNSYLPDMSQMIQVRLSYANASSDDPTPGVKNGWSEDGFTIGDFVNAIKVNTDDGYLLEASIDLAASAAAIEKASIGLGDTVGFNAIACDNDGESTRENIGTVIQDFVWNEADTMLRLVLVETVNGLPVTRNDYISVYPTVVTNQLRFSDITRVTSVDIINLQGQVVSHTQKPSEFVSTEKLSSGIYTVRINTTGGGVINQKIIKR
jgi:hypothetical protein